LLEKHAAAPQLFALPTTKTSVIRIFFLCVSCVCTDLLKQYLRGAVDSHVHIFFLYGFRDGTLFISQSNIHMADACGFTNFRGFRDSICMYLDVDFDLMHYILYRIYWTQNIPPPSPLLHTRVLVRLVYSSS
jgi:hypothetical protein